MRKPISIGMLCGMMTLSAIAPARAHELNGTEVIFDGAIPCAVVCSYWIDNGYSPCETPFPPGSYVDHVTPPAPTPPPRAIIVLEATLDSTVDWDLFICPRYESLLPGNILGEPCDNALGRNNPVPIGCHEDASAVVRAGETKTLRAYNWSDPLPARGEYAFRFS